MHGNLVTILKLRMIVGFLGEKAQHAWWSTAFYDSSSRLFLEPIFPKTAGLAQYHGVLEAARQLHDQHLNVGSYHLFRLPEEIEQDLHGFFQSKPGSDIAGDMPTDKDEALNALSKLATNNSSLQEGPVSVGQISDLGKPETLELIADAYLSAFQNGNQAFPYLVGHA